MAELLSQAEYARYRGVSRKTTTQWKSEGILVMVGKKVDRDASDQALAEIGRQGVTKRSLGNKQGNNQGNEQSNNSKQLKPVPKAAVESVQETLKEDGQAVSPSPGGMTFVQARTAAMVLRAQTARVKLQQLKKELIDRAKALAHVYKMARQIRDSWQNWPARVSSRMAAELDIDPHVMHTTLEVYVREHLEELAGVKVRID
jgi:hypothetical protein